MVSQYTFLALELANERVREAEARNRLLRPGRHRLGARPDGGLRNLARRRTLGPLLGRRGVAPVGIAGGRARRDRPAGGVVVVGGSARRVRTRPRRSHLAPLVGWQAM